MVVKEGEAEASKVSSVASKVRTNGTATSGKPYPGLDCLKEKPKEKERRKKNLSPINRTELFEKA